MGSMEELKQGIIELCNRSGLPLECIVYVLKDAWRDAEASLHTLLEQQKQQQTQAANTENAEEKAE